MVWLLLLVLPFVFAQVVNISIVDYPKVVLPTNKYVPIKIAIYTNPEGYRIAEASLYIRAEDPNKYILYSESREIGLREGTTLYKIYLPLQKIISKLDEKDGYFVLTAQVNVLFENETYESKESSASVNIYVHNYTTYWDIDILYIRPNLDKVREFGKEINTFEIGIKNNGFEKLENLEVRFEIYDTKGNLVYYENRFYDLKEDEEKDVRFDINFGILEPGYYKLVIRIRYKGVDLFKKEWDVKIGKEIIPLELIRFEIIPPKYKPGDLILVRMFLKNKFDKEIILQPILYSEDIGIFRTLSTVVFEPFETKEVKIVVPLPSKLEPGRYKVFVRFESKEYIQNIPFYLEIPGKKKVPKKKILTIEVIGDRTLKVGENKTLTLRITTFIEDIIPVRLEAITKNAKAILPEKIVIGGYGLSKEVNLTLVGKIPGKDILILEVYDNKGNLLANKTVEYEVLGKTIYKPRKDILLSLILATAVVVIAVYLLIKRREERPSE